MADKKSIESIFSHKNKVPLSTSKSIKFKAYKISDLFPKLILFFIILQKLIISSLLLFRRFFNVSHKFTFFSLSLKISSIKL